MDLKETLIQFKVDMLIGWMQQLVAIPQADPEHEQVNDGQTIETYGPNPGQTAPSQVFAAGGQPPTRLPAGGHVELVHFPQPTHLKSAKTWQHKGILKIYHRVSPENSPPPRIPDPVDGFERILAKIQGRHD